MIENQQDIFNRISEKQDEAWKEFTEKITKRAELVRQMKLQAKPKVLKQQSVALQTNQISTHSIKVIETEPQEVVAKPEFNKKEQIQVKRVHLKQNLSKLEQIQPVKQTKVEEQPRITDKMSPVMPSIRLRPIPIFKSRLEALEQLPSKSQQFKKQVSDILPWRGATVHKNLVNSFQGGNKLLEKGAGKGMTEDRIKLPPIIRNGAHAGSPKPKHRK